MRTLNINDDLELDTGTYRVIGRRGNLLGIRNQSTGDDETIALSELTTRLRSVPEWSSPVSPASLDLLRPEDRADVQFWARQIDEMSTGSREGHNTPRPQYDPKITTLNERVESKVAELRGLGFRASRAPLLRKRTLWQQGGAAALIDQRKLRSAARYGEADPRIIAAINKVLSENVKASTRTKSYLCGIVVQELVKSYEFTADQIPSESSLRRYFTAADVHGTATSRATTRRSRANVPNRRNTTKRLLLPGEQVQVDSTPLDVIVRVGPRILTGPKKGEWLTARPHLTTMIDVATRTVIGASFNLEGTRGYDHSLLLAQTLVSPSARPNKDVHRAFLQARHPWATLMSPEERQIREASRPFIYPRSLTIDNGKDYLSDVFVSACRKFGISQTFSAIHTPTDKPVVERNLQSINTLFTQGLPGYTGNHNVDRGYKLEKDDNLLSLAMLAELFDDWVLKIWQNRPHKGLSDPFEPSHDFTPNEAYEGAAPYAGEIEVPLDQSDYIELLPCTWRTIGKTGIQFKDRHFDADALHPLRGTLSPVPGKGKQWKIHFNPYDHERVWVRTRERQWIECLWREANLLEQPFLTESTAGMRNSRRTTEAREAAIRAGTPMPGSSTIEAPGIADKTLDSNPAELSTGHQPIADLPTTEIDDSDLGDFDFEA